MKLFEEYSYKVKKVKTETNYNISISVFRGRELVAGTHTKESEDFQYFKMAVELLDGFINQKELLQNFVL